MKKHLILVMLAALFTFSACSEDDDNVADEKDPVVGTWAVVSIEPAAINIEECEQTSTITFNENNTASATFYSAEANCTPLATTGAWENEGNDTYSMTVPVLGDVSGTVEFNGPSEFFFTAESGVTITLQKQ